MPSKSSSAAAFNDDMDEDISPEAIESQLNSERERARLEAAKSVAGKSSSERTFKEKMIHRAASSQNTSNTIGGTAKQLKNLKRIGWAIKGASLTFTSLGDILFSVWVFLFWANMELLIFPLFIPWWKQTTLEKAITVFLDLVIIFILFCVVSLILLLADSVNEACGILDDVQKSPAFIPATILKLISKAIGVCPNQ